MNCWVCALQWASLFSYLRNIQVVNPVIWEELQLHCSLKVLTCTHWWLKKTPGPFLDPWTYLWTHFLQSPEPCLFKGFGCILVDLPSALAFLLPAQPIHPSIPFHFPLSFSTLHLSNTLNHFHNTLSYLSSL